MRKMSAGQSVSTANRARSGSSDRDTSNARCQRPQIATSMSGSRPRKRCPQVRNQVVVPSRPMQTQLPLARVIADRCGTVAVPGTGPSSGIGWSGQPCAPQRGDWGGHPQGPQEAHWVSRAGTFPVD